MKPETWYRLLNVGEIVKDGDEEYTDNPEWDNNLGWQPVAVEFIGEAVQEAIDPPVRRLLTSTWPSELIKGVR